MHSTLQVMNLNVTPMFYLFENGEPVQMSGRKFVLKMHQWALERGLPGYGM